MARYVENKAGFSKLAMGPKLREHMQKVGEFWASQLRTAAPRSRTGDKTGADARHYADSISVKSVVVGIGKKSPLPRAAVHIIADVPYASVLEHGNAHVKNPPRPMGHLLDRIRAADPDNRAR
jgi:hypothetical protein